VGSRPGLEDKIRELPIIARDVLPDPDHTVCVAAVRQLFHDPDYGKSGPAHFPLSCVNRKRRRSVKPLPAPTKYSPPDP
jgi:hypothetical protein